MGGDVGVGVALEPLRLVGPREPGEVHRDAVDEAVDVGADADTEGRGWTGGVHEVIMPEGQSHP
ncbi:hypothetical protein GCM10009623_12230 [Nocardioides aestuarii]